MSGPVGAVDTTETQPAELTPVLEITESRAATVGTATVRRALPRRGRRTVGAWCFVDHFGPGDEGGPGMQVGPHPHIGLQTVTWLLDGEVVHHDSLGSEQLIRPGQLNLMTAGQGVVHSEESPAPRPGSRMHGVQLWVAQPEETRFGTPDFEHHAELPRVDLGDAVATVLVGSLADATSPARTDTPLVGVDLVLREGAVVVPLDRSFEHALVVVEGAVTVDDRSIEPGALAYLGGGRDELAVSATEGARCLLIGGEPFGERLLMFWNFVGRTRAEIDDAYDDWTAGRERFGPVASALSRIESPRPPWSPG